MEQRWRIELLGGLRVLRGDHVLSRFGAQKVGALLAYLAYYLPRHHPRAELIELFWPEGPLEAGRDSLSTALYRLRQLFESPVPSDPPVIRSERAGVRLNPAAVITDVAEFDSRIEAARRAPEPAAAELLSHAVAIYQGPLLPDESYDWVLQERAWLAERYFRALAALLACLEKAGKVEAALEYARRGVSADPLREEAHRDLIRLLLVAGQRTAARRQYDELERLLTEHLGTTPEPATTALLAPGSVPSSPSGPPTTPPPTAVELAGAARHSWNGGSLAEASPGSRHSRRISPAGRATPAEHAQGDDLLEEVPAAAPPDLLPQAGDRPAAAGRAPLEPVGGAVPLGSAFYIVRPADAAFQAAVARQDSIVLVEGARQVGKTSLLARGLHHARGAGSRVIWTDLQTLNAAHLETLDALFRKLALSVADQLDLEVSPDDGWHDGRGPSDNLKRYWQRVVFPAVAGPIVWGLDEVDRLFACDFAGEAFGLFRSWHNERAAVPNGPWQRLTLAMAYATEHHLFIADVNQSPFNVGTRIALGDFTREQVAELNTRYGTPIQGEAELERFMRLVGGHPYLVRLGLHEMATQGAGLATLEAQAEADVGVFSGHLRRVLLLLSQDPELCEAVREVLRGMPCPTVESFYRLRSAGVLAGESARDARPRCRLYAAYLARCLL